MVAAGRSRAVDFAPDTAARPTSRCTTRSCEAGRREAYDHHLDRAAQPAPARRHRDVRPWLATGLHDLADPSLDVVGLGPKGATAMTNAAARCQRALRRAALIAGSGDLATGRPEGVERRTRPRRWPALRGGAADAVHSIAMHDLLWRDEPGISTPTGVRFHDRRLKLIVDRKDLRVLVTSPDWPTTRRRRYRRVADPPRSTRGRRRRLQRGLRIGGARTARRARLHGPFTLYAGTREPRKNIERLIAAHRIASAKIPDLGSLVLVGPSGWGGSRRRRDRSGFGVARTVTGSLSRRHRRRVRPTRRRWGLPPVEALNVGTRVVASATTPSVASNERVVRVDPLDVESIAEGLLAALREGDDYEVKPLDVNRGRSHVAQRRLDHLVAWR